MTCQAELRDDEALVLFLDTDARFKPLPEETFLWVVTKTDVRWVRFGTGQGSASTRGRWRCAAGSTRREPGMRRSTLSIAFQRHLFRSGSGERQAVALRCCRGPMRSTKACSGEVEDLIKGKHLIVVPSGALTQLPFQVLVTQPPGKNPATYGDYRGIAWFSRSHPVTVLPAVSSLKALRRNAQSSLATKPFVGIGNPLLDGPDQRYARLRRAAFEFGNVGMDQGKFAPKFECPRRPTID